MDIFTHVKNHALSPFSYQFPKGSKQRETSYPKAAVPQQFRILTVAISLGVATLASRRYNLFGSAALGAITFYATAGMFKSREISRINLLAEKYRNRSDSSSDEEDNDISSEEHDSDDKTVTKSSRTSHSTTAEATTQFTQYLQNKGVTKDSLDTFLTGAVKKVMVDELDSINSNYKGQEEECRKAFFSELKDLYLEFDKFNKIPTDFTIFVKTLAGKTSDISLGRDTTIEQLRTLVFTETGEHPEKQRLIYAGKQLDTERTVSDYNIQRESTLHLALRINGASWEYKTLRGNF